MVVQSAFQPGVLWGLQAMVPLVLRPVVSVVFPVGYLVASQAAEFSVARFLGIALGLLVRLSASS